MATDELKRLQPFRFRGIEFPCTEFDTDFKQRLAHHAYPNRDGAHIESTGRDPIMVRASIPMLTGAQPGPNEKWSQDVEALFPTTFRRLLDAFADRTTGDLEHPIIGRMRVKPESLRFTAKGSTRDGVHVEASWIETIEVDSDKITIGDKYPLTSLVEAAGEMDTALGKPYNVGLPKPKVSFADLARALQSIPDQASFFAGGLIGKLDNIIYHAGNVLDAFKRAPDSLQWKLVNTSTKLIAAANDAKAVLTTSGKDIAIYTVQVDSTLAAIAVEISRTLNELMQLNSQLIRLPTIPKGTKVRYYK